MKDRVFEDTFWLASGSAFGPAALAPAFAQPRFFAVKLPTRESCVQGLYALRLSYDHSKGGDVSALVWDRWEGLGLPSFSGRIVRRRFGPIASVYVRAHCTYGRDLPGRLFDEAIGGRLSREAFEALVAAVRIVLTRPSQSHSPVEVR